MEEDEFEFKGQTYKRQHTSQGTRVINVSTPTDRKNKDSTKEVISEHLRNLNKRQLRERIMLYEVLVKHQGQLLKELEKDRIV